MTPFSKRTQRRIFEQKITKIAKGLWVGALVLVLPSRARSVAERDRSFAVRFFKRVRSHHFEQKITKIAKGLWVCVLRQCCREAQDPSGVGPRGFDFRDASNLLLPRGKLSVLD